MRPKPVQTFKGEELGVAVLLLAPLATLVIASALLLVSVGRDRQIEASLQLAADSAAQAGALEYARLGAESVDDVNYSLESLCTHSQCYENVLSSAINALNLTLPKEFIPEEGLLLSAASEQDFGYFWDLPNGSVHVQRGRWAADEFQALDADWSVLNPGVPTSFLANALRITLTHAGSSSSLGLLSRRITSSSTAKAARTEPIVTAPLAIPYCALVRNGDIPVNMSELCMADIYFTATRRFCRPGEEGCGELPGFSMDFLVSPYAAPDEFQSVRSQINHFFADSWHGSTSLTSLNACYWPTRHFGMGADNEGSYSDNFGLYGLSNPSSAEPTELEIFEALVFGQSVQLGDSFKVSETGLSQSEYSSSLFPNPLPVQSRFFGASTDFTNQALGPLLGLTPRVEGSFNYGEIVRTASLGLGILWEVNNLAYSPLGDNLDSTGEFPTPGERALACQGYTSPEPRFLGACNSMRNGFGIWEAWSNLETEDGEFFQSPPLVGTLGGNSNLTVTRMMPAAVIADARTSSCDGIAGSSSDPFYDEEGEYFVVGFVEIGIVDYDIGRTPPSLTGITRPLLRTELWDTSKPEAFENLLDEGLIYTNADTSDPNFPLSFRPSWYVDWGTTADPPEYGNCNVIRARISCNAQFIPSTAPGQRTRPIMVD